MKRQVRPPADRFWSQVDRRGPDDCWPWLAYRTHKGYGLFRSEKTTKAHRFSYELANGPTPDGMTLDHLCRNRACVNPAHLEPVTNRENIMRGESFSAKNARKTHCPNGHPFDETNTRVRVMSTGAPQRRCRECHRQEWQRQKLSA